MSESTRSHTPANAPSPGVDELDAPPGARRRLIDLDGRGVAVSVLEWGDPKGPLALSSHANGFCAASWTEVAEALRGRFHVVAPDARGQGHSPEPPEGVDETSLSWEALRDDIVALSGQLLEETGQSQIALGMGHSFGGTLTLAAAARVPGRFGALLALDPVILPPRIAGVGRGNEMAAGARRRRSKFASRAAARAGFAEKPFFAQWTQRALDLYVDFGLGPSPDPAAGPDEVVLRCTPEVEATIFESVIGFDINEEATRIDVPAGILWARGGNFPRDVHAELAGRIPRGWVQEVDAGHLMLMEQPALVLEAVDRVLGEVG